MSLLQLLFDRLSTESNIENKLLLLLDDDSTNSCNTPDATDNRTFGFVINTDDDYLDDRFECRTRKCRTLTSYNILQQQQQQQQ